MKKAGDISANKLLLNVQNKDQRELLKTKKQQQIYYHNYIKGIDHARAHTKVAARPGNTVAGQRPLGILERTNQGNWQ